LRILHTADWHLGRIFHNTHLTHDQAYVLEEFVALVVDTKPDVVVIAGDVYDRAVPPTEAINLLDEVLSQILLDAQVPVMVIAGNHDSPERLGFGDKVLARQNFHVIGQVSADNRPVILSDAHGQVYFCPLPYGEPAVVRERLAIAEAHSHEQALAFMAERCQRSIPKGVRRVGVAHAFVAGGLKSESERPLTIGGIETVSAEIFASFNYVALGHLHQAQQVGRAGIRYAGSILKYSFSEANHQKSVALIEMDAAGDVKVELIDLKPRRDVRQVEGYLADILAAAQQDGHKEDYLMVTLKDQGAILDPLGKLRQIYPHILHVGKAEQLIAGQLTFQGDDRRRRTEADLFADFFTQVTGQPLNQAENQLLCRLLNQFQAGEREAGL
jgi:exonuclease SbcD